MRMLMLAYGSVVVLTGSPAAHGQDIPPSAPACSLKMPPAAAGEEVGSSGAPMKIFPRAKDIPTSYTGCQKVWLLLRGNWISFSTRYFEEGTVKVFLGPLLNEQDQWRCVFQNGLLIPSSAKRACPSFEEANSRMQSAPSGCLAELNSAKRSERCSRYE
jgi:hypothetical protein